MYSSNKHTASQKKKAPVHRRAGGEKLAAAHNNRSHNTVQKMQRKTQPQQQSQKGIPANNRVATPLHDNRQQTTVQKKLVTGMNRAAGLQQPLQKKAINTGLPANLKNGIENLSGISMDGVKVHYNSSKPAQLNAHAYAQGKNIHLAPGQEKHLPHEAWHVVQQAQGRVKPTVQMKETLISDNTNLEKEADVMGKKAEQNNSIKTPQKNELNRAFGGVVQRFQGKPRDTLYALIRRVLSSKHLPPNPTVENTWPIIYEYATSETPFTPLEREKIDLGNELRNEDLRPENRGGFFFISMPGSFDYKDKLSSKRRDKKTPLWNEHRITLNAVPDELIAIMGYLGRELRNFPFVTEFKCPNSFEKVKKRLDNIVIYYIEDPDQPGVATTALLQFVHNLPKMEGQQLFREERPAMSGDAFHPGIGLGEGHGSLIEPRAKIIAQAFVDWFKKGKKPNLFELAGSYLEKQGYSLDNLHMDPKKKNSWW